MILIMESRCSARERFNIGNALKGGCLQSVSRENGCRFVKGTMQRGLPSPEIIVIHCRQIVMDEGIGVEQLNGFADPSGLGNGATRNQLGTGKGEATAQLLTGILREVSERV